MPAFGELERQLLVWMLCALRPGATFLTLPMFGGANVPAMLRFVIGLALGMPAIATAPHNIDAEFLVSVSGIILIISEIALGLTIGFSMQIALAATLLGGEVLGNAMGLGFASMNDPFSAHPSTAVSQLFSILGTFLFLSLGGQLIVASLIVNSFHSMPLGGVVFSPHIYSDICGFGGVVFAAGLSVAVPVGFALILVQIVMAFVGRATPSLNLIAVGMPVVLIAGIILLPIAFPAIAEAIGSAIQLGLGEAQRISKG
jgi:flagellar biosynthetic protein FliR